MSQSIWFTLALLLAGAQAPPLASRSGAARPVQNEPALPQTGAAAEPGDRGEPDEPADGEPAGREEEGSGEPEQDGPDDRAAPDQPPSEPGEDGTDEPEGPPGQPREDGTGLELELDTLANTSGEEAVDALLHISRGRWSGALGIGNGGSPQAAQRQWARAQLGLDVGVALSAQALVQPGQDGSSQEQARLGAAHETERGSWEVALLQQDARLSASAAGLASAARAAQGKEAPASAIGMELSGAALSLDGARALGPLPGLRATVHAGAGLYSLTLPKSAATPWAVVAPWDRLGQRSLAWPARAEGALGLSLERDEGAASISLGAGLPAQPGALEAGLVIAGEHKLGRATLSVQLSAAHLWPGDLWQGALTFGARWRFAPG